MDHTLSGARRIEGHSGQIVLTDGTCNMEVTRNVLPFDPGSVCHPSFRTFWISSFRKYNGQRIYIMKWRNRQLTTAPYSYNSTIATGCTGSDFVGRGVIVIPPAIFADLCGPLQYGQIALEVVRNRESGGPINNLWAAKGRWSKHSAVISLT